MKITYLMITGLLLFNVTGMRAHEPLTAIDSLYLSSVAQYYKIAENVKNEIWQGMELSPVCLFRIDGPAIFFR